ncbi:MAG TPA: MOSC domain-containing protein [Candidatus Saccharimonadales bacterium]
MPEIVQVSIGTPEIIGARHGQDVVSSIRKYALAGTEIVLTPDGILGDEQADKRVVGGKRIHGGLLQAVYMYPAAHLGAWAIEIGTSDQPGTFGENLTVTDLTEEDVRIGDRFSWGNSLLEVTKPRRPCYKLPIHLGVESVAAQMMQNGRCGWYVSVIEPGTVRQGSGLELVYSDPAAVTIAETFAAKTRRDPTIPDMPTGQ